MKFEFGIVIIAKKFILTSLPCLKPQLNNGHLRFSLRNIMKDTQAVDLEMILQSFLAIVIDVRMKSCLLGRHDDFLWSFTISFYRNSLIIIIITITTITLKLQCLLLLKQRHKVHTWQFLIALLTDTSRTTLARE